ncbi:MAG: ATP-binding protein [Spirochaetota bacterium]
MAIQKKIFISVIVIFYSLISVVPSSGEHEKLSFTVNGYTEIRQAFYIPTQLLDSRSRSSVSDEDFISITLPGVIKDKRFHFFNSITYRVNFEIEKVPDFDLFLFSPAFGSARAAYLNGEPLTTFTAFRAKPELTDRWRLVLFQLEKAELKPGKNTFEVDLNYLWNYLDGAAGSIYIGSLEGVKTKYLNSELQAVSGFQFLGFAYTFILMTSLVLLVLRKKLIFAIESLAILTCVVVLFFLFVDLGLGFTAGNKLAAIFKHIDKVLLLMLIAGLLEGYTKNYARAFVMFAWLLLLLHPISMQPVYTVIINLVVTAIVYFFIFIVLIRERRNSPRYFYLSIGFFFFFLIAFVVLNTDIQIRVNTLVILLMLGFNTIYFSFININEFLVYMRIQEDLKHAKELAEAANNAKSQFLASMSHEIRTPLNGILGMTELALQTEMSDQQREYLNMVKESANTLLDVINEVLDLSKIETGKLKLEHVDFSIRNLIQQVVSTLNPLALKKEIRLEYKIGDNVPAYLKGDPVRLRQVIYNLLGNAVKFTERGYCKIEVEYPSPGKVGGGKHHGEITLLFTVQDTGIGIPEDKKEQIFDPFIQADESMTRKYGGTGLGLAICKQLVELMHGKIWIESRVNAGSNFFFTASFQQGVVPPEEYETAAVDKNVGEETLSLKVLLAEDNVINQKVAVKFLKNLNHEVVIAENGQEVIEKLKEITRRADSYEKTKKYDLVLMDVEMPELDGLEATRIIRKSGKDELDNTIPIIALTAHALKGDRDRFLEAGMDDYISKPIDLHELKMVLLRVMRSKILVRKFLAASQAAGTKRLLDTTGVLGRIGGDTEFLLILYGLFKESESPRLEVLKEAIRNKDRDSAVLAAHSIKTASINIGAQRVAEIAERLESELLDQKMAESVDTAGQLEKEFILTLQAMDFKDGMKKQ